jgi:type II secretory pathway pseudopilin PulG
MMCWLKEAELLTMKFNRWLRLTSGFTIVEAMIAATILGLALGSVMAVSSQCMRYLTDIRRTARSSQVLQQKMEDIRLLSWSQLAALPSSFTDPNDTNHVYAGTITQSAYDSYNGTTTVMKVTLTVTWTNQVYKILTNSLSTLVSNGGLNKYIF